MCVNTLTKATIMVAVGGRILLPQAALAVLAAVAGAAAGLAIAPIGLVFTP